MTHRVACLLGTSISLGSSVCMLLGLLVAWLLEVDLMLGVMSGGVVGVMLAVGIFAGSLSHMSASDSSLQEPLVVDNVEATFTQKGKLGIAFVIRRSTRDGNKWLVVAEIAKRGQAGIVPGLTPGMAVKQVQGQPLRLDTFESVLLERPLQVTFGVVQPGDTTEVVDEPSLMRELPRIETQTESSESEVESEEDDPPPRANMSGSGIDPDLSPPPRQPPKEPPPPMDPPPPPPPMEPPLPMDPPPAHPQQPSEQHISKLQV